MGAALECRRFGQRCWGLRFGCGVPSAPPPSCPRARCHPPVSTGAPPPWRDRSRIRRHLDQAGRQHRLGRGYLSHERAPERRHENGRSRQVPHRLEAHGREMADHRRRMVQRPGTIELRDYLLAFRRCALFTRPKTFGHGVGGEKFERPERAPKTSLPFLTLVTPEATASTTD